MAIQNMPTALTGLIQQGFLEREFKSQLSSALAYRRIADKEPVSINIGETVTKTRPGYKSPVTTPISPSGNTNLDNGLSPTPFTIEQYTLGIGQYADTIDLNIVTSQVGIKNQFLQNAKTNGMQAGQSLDRIARNTLFGGSLVSGVSFGGYLGGNTRVRTTLGAPAATIAVDDVRGFELAISAGGIYSAVTPGNTATVLVGSNTYTLQAVTRDGVNVSTTVLVGDPLNAMRGVSGTLTFSTNVTVADGTALNAVVHANAPTVIRPGATPRTTWANLVAGDNLTAAMVQLGVAQLRANTGVMDDVNIYLDPFSMTQLFRDPDFKLAYQGQYGSATFQKGQIFQLYGANFIQTTEAPVQSYGALTIRRPIIVAMGALIEGDFAGMVQRAHDAYQNSEVQFIDGICQVVRGPLDRLQQIIAQSWFWIGGFVTPVDATANQNIIPTASNAYLKRAVVLEHV